MNLCEIFQSCDTILALTQTLIRNEYKSMCNFLYKYALVEPIVAQIFTQRYWQLSDTGTVSLLSPDDAPVVLIHTDATLNMYGCFFRIQ